MDRSSTQIWGKLSAEFVGRGSVKVRRINTACGTRNEPLHLACLIVDNQRLCFSFEQLRDELEIDSRIDGANPRDASHQISWNVAAKQ